MKRKQSILTIAFLLMSTLIFSQYPQMNSVSGEVKYAAEQLTTKYSNQLALTSVQIPLFKNVVEEYMVKAGEAKKRYDGREQLDVLVELQAQETLEMNDILTQPQYQLYKKLKYDYQPLKTIKPEKVKKE